MMMMMMIKRREMGREMVMEHGGAARSGRDAAIVRCPSTGACHYCFDERVDLTIVFTPLRRHPLPPWRGRRSWIYIRARRSSRQ
jgi:hypothetical protein